ncbi:hypothetical protein D3C71_1667920 [compost metagenome]
MGTPKRRKNSNISSSMPLALPRAVAFSTVRMLTTEGPTWSTKSVKSGNPLTTADGCALATPCGKTNRLDAPAKTLTSAAERSVSQTNFGIIDLS